jgi:hypothetical protein
MNQSHMDDWDIHPGIQQCMATLMKNDVGLYLGALLRIASFASFGAAVT